MRVLLIDDDVLVTSGIKTIIEMKAKQNNFDLEVCAVGKNGLEAIALYKQYQPDVTLMDIRMPEMDGISAGRHIITQFPEAKLIYLTTFLEDDYIIDALRLGAKGYLMKTDYNSLLPAINAVMNGQRVFGDQIVEKIPQFLDNNQRHLPKLFNDSLSAKEHEIIYWVSEGLNNKEISQQMHFSEGTIRNYLSDILDKLDIRDRTQLAIHYYKHLY